MEKYETEQVATYWHMEILDTVYVKMKSTCMYFLAVAPGISELVE